jgi:hypothetical protein
MLPLTDRDRPDIKGKRFQVDNVMDDTVSNKTTLQYPAFIANEIYTLDWFEN